MPHPDLRPTPPRAGDRRPSPGLEALPDRIQRILALVQKHQAYLCAFTTLAFEVHIRGESIKCKISFNPED